MNEPIRDTAHSLLSVARNAVDLAKAELHVATLEGKAALTKFAFAFGLGYLAVMLAQIALLILALTPVLINVLPWPFVIGSLAIPTVGTLVAGLAARHAFKRHKGGDATRHSDAPESARAPVSIAVSPDQVER